MPASSIIALCAIIGAFVGFAGFLLYGDLTWHGRLPPGSAGERRR